jgi:transglutaminase-like putative cysteine protease
MSRPVLITAFLLVALGLGIFSLKVLRYGLPLRPADTRGLWQVELRVTVRGDGRQGSVAALIPSSDEGQVILDERSASDRLRFAIRTRGQTRIGMWTGWLEGVQEIVYEFRVQSDAVRVALPGPPYETPPRALSEWTQPSPEFPASSPDVRALLQRISLPPPENVLDRVRNLYAFVVHEVATVATAGDDAVLTLAQREGSPTGKARLLVTLLRASGVPARLVRGLELRERAMPQDRVWCQAWVGGVWIPMSPDAGFFGERPADWVSLGGAGRELVEATGARAVGYRFRSLREQLRPEEVALLMAPEHPLLARLSLYNLPLGTQSSLRLLLVLPLGALIIAVLRNIVGVTTYGTFMPLLIAFALRSFPLGQGLALVAFVLTLGVVTRLLLERLRLLMVPRLAILVCLVVLSVTGLALAGDQIGNRDLFAGILFPIVILTMLVERFTIAIAEEGLRAALIPAGWSVFAASMIYPVLRDPSIQYLTFTFPELIFVVMGILVWIGGYTGYRISDLIRFRLLAMPTPETRP